MTKPNVVEEIMAHAARDEIVRRLGVAVSGPDTDSKSWLEHIGVIRAIIADLDIVGLAIVPHDWNHREEDWSLESVSEWLER